MDQTKILLLIIVILILGLFWDQQRKKGSPECFKQSASILNSSHVSELFACLQFDSVTTSVIKNKFAEARQNNAITISFVLGVDSIKKVFYKAKFVVTGIVSDWVYLVPMTDDARSADGGTLTFNQQARLSVPLQDILIDIEVRPDLRIPIDSKVSIFPTSSGGALVMKHESQFPATINQTMVDGWSPAVYIENIPLDLIDASTNDIKTYTPPICFVQYSVNLDTWEANESIIQVVNSSASKLFVSPEFNRTAINSIILLGGDMASDVYFYHTTRNINPIVPVPQEKLDLAANFKKYEKEGKTCDKMFDPVEYRGSTEEEARRKLTQDKAAACLGAGSLDPIAFNLGGRDETASKEELLSNASTCNIKATLIEGDRYNVRCEARNATQAGKLVFPPTHEIWNIPPLPPPAIPLNEKPALAFWTEVTYSLGNRKILIERNNTFRTKSADDLLVAWERYRVSHRAVIVVRSSVYAVSNIVTDGDSTVVMTATDLSESAKYTIARVMFEPR